jgi:hypothetical protein
MELIAAMMLLTPALVSYGAILTLGTMSGAWQTTPWQR